MIIETGKRYVSRSGSITDPLEDNSMDSMRWVFRDPETQAKYTSKGDRHVESMSSHQDLIREFRGEVEAMGPTELDLDEARTWIKRFAVWNKARKDFVRNIDGLCLTWVDHTAATSYILNSTASEYLIINLETGETVD